MRWSEAGYARFSGVFEAGEGRDADSASSYHSHAPKHVGVNRMHCRSKDWES